MNRKAVLIVDDEADIRELLVLTLSRMGVDADTASTFQEAQEALKTRQYDLALTDMRLPDGDGLMVLRHIAEHHGNTPVAVITAYGSTENAVAALKAGAFDYLAKPIKLEQLRPLVMSALKLPKPAQNRRVATGENSATGLPRLLGESAPIARARDMIAKLARSQAPVYITGESGSGKEVAARLIHSGSAPSAPSSGSHAMRSRRSATGPSASSAETSGGSHVGSAAAPSRARSAPRTAARRVAYRPAMWRMASRL